jgi:hypothetical protein
MLLPIGDGEIATREKGSPEAAEEEVGGWYA